jgi:hypothetical protein
MRRYMPRLPAVAFSDEEIKNILLEHRYLERADAICQKWGISRDRLRTWKRDPRFAPLRAGLRELVIVALRAGPVRDPAELVSFLDHQDHAIYTPAEITGVLDALEQEGKAARRDGAWHYDEARLGRGRPFIF